MAPDLPVEPAAEIGFFQKKDTARLHLARCQAMLVPMTPPPTMRISQLTAICGKPWGEVLRTPGVRSTSPQGLMNPSFRKQRRAEVAFAEVGQDDDDQSCRRSRARWATWTAAHAAAPQLMPHSMPSSRASRRAMAKESSSLTWTTSSMMSTFRTPGMKPAPMPWILCRPGLSGPRPCICLRDDRAGHRLDRDRLERRLALLDAPRRRR